jgi:hypothetical protein
MSGNMIAFGRNRRERDFAHLDIAPGRFFIETDKTSGSEWDDLLSCIDERPGLIVAVLSKADLGRGMGQVNAIKAIEERGCTIAVLPSDKPASAPLDPGKITPEMEAEMCRIWRNAALSEATRLARIAAIDGMPPLTKHQVYYLCVTKPKRNARMK